MEPLQATTDRRLHISAYHAAITLAGVCALALVALSVPSVWLAILSIIYCLLAPAWLLRRLLPLHVGPARPIISAIMLVPAVAAAWIVVFAIIWIASQNVSDGMGSATLAITIIAMSALLLWQGPISIDLDPRSFAAKHFKNILFFGIGLTLGLGTLIAASFL
jgi:hypothetical protein